MLGLLVVGCTRGSTDSLFPQNGASSPPANNQALIIQPGESPTTGDSREPELNAIFQGFAHGGTGGQDNIRIHMDIICLNVNGNTANIGGIITGGNQGLLGQMASFSVVDGGEGRNAPS